MAPSRVPEGTQATKARGKNKNKMHLTKSKYVPSIGRTKFGPSVTVPDESMSLREILKRYASGRPLAGGRNQQWSETPELDDGVNVEALDFEERRQYVESKKQELDSIRSRSKSTKKADNTATTTTDEQGTSKEGGGDEK